MTSISQVDGNVLRADIVKKQDQLDNLQARMRANEQAKMLADAAMLPAPGHVRRVIDLVKKDKVRERCANFTLWDILCFIPYLLAVLLAFLIGRSIWDLISDVDKHYLKPRINRWTKPFFAGFTGRDQCMLASGSKTISICTEDSDFKFKSNATTLNAIAKHFELNNFKDLTHPEKGTIARCRVELYTPELCSAFYTRCYHLN